MTWAGDFRDNLATDLESTADWRSQKSVEFPHDVRNKLAEQECRRLAEGVRLLGDEVFYPLMKAAESEDFALAWSESRRMIGFVYTPESAEKLLLDLLDNCSTPSTASAI